MGCLITCPDAQLWRSAARCGNPSSGDAACMIVFAALSQPYPTNTFLSFRLGRLSQFSPPSVTPVSQQHQARPGGAYQPAGVAVAQGQALAASMHVAGWVLAKSRLTCVAMGVCPHATCSHHWSLAGSKQSVCRSSHESCIVAHAGWEAHTNAAASHLLSCLSAAGLTGHRAVGCWLLVYSSRVYTVLLHAYSG